MKNLILITLSFILLALFPAKLYSQDIDLSKYISDTENITARTETEKFYWIGTNHGLYYILKKRDRMYHMTAKNSLFLSDTITAIAARQNGEVYIGTRNGIIRYDNYAFLLITSENSSLRSNNITSLACVEGTEIFAGTYDGGITIFSDTRSKTYTTENASLVNDHIVAFEKIRDDSLIALLGNNIRVGIRNRQFTVLNSPSK